MSLNKSEFKNWNKEELIQYALLRNNDSKDYEKNLNRLEAQRKYWEDKYRKLKERK
jgi:hypothetical protein